MEEPAREEGKLALLFGIDPTRERLARAADLSSADRMRKLEREQGDKWVQTRYTRQDKQFVRKAASGGWQQILSAESVEMIESAWGQIMKSLGYELSTHAASAPPAMSKGRR
jgi:hypothetical protein